MNVARSLLAIVILVGLSACDINSPSSGRNAAPLSDGPGGTADSTTTSAVVFPNLKSTQELESALSGVKKSRKGSINLDAIIFYKDGINGKKNYSSPRLSNKEKINKFRKWVIEGSRRRTEHERRIMGKRYKSIDKEEFVKSKEMQKLALSVVESYEQRKSLVGAVNNGGGLIYAAIVSGTPNEIKQIDNNIDVEGYVTSKAAKKNSRNTETPPVPKPERVIEMEDKRYNKTNKKYKKIEGIKSRSHASRIYKDVNKKIKKYYGIDISQ